MGFVPELLGLAELKEPGPVAVAVVVVVVVVVVVE